MIGIGGIGMSALAQLYAHEGHEVSGSDRDESPTTELLKSKGIRVYVGHKEANVPEDAGLVVYSDAVWDDNVERIRAKELGKKEVSYFDALGEVSKDKYTIAVSGTHGKTTTTALLTKILRDTGHKPTAIIGSLVTEFGSNFVAGEGDLFIVEACEYKDHVLKLEPKMLVITNLEWDHTDWFETVGELQDTFREAVDRVLDEGVIVANPNDPVTAPVLFNSRVPVVDFTKEEVPELQLIGEFNKMNARAARAAARAYAPHTPVADIDKASSSFSGTWRRFEKKGVTQGGALVYDDYAHHPTAIRATISAAREAFPSKKITVVFHPHLYTRTRDLFHEFATELAKADSVIMVPIYPAREEPIPGITSDALALLIAEKNPNVVSLHTFDEVEVELRKNTSEEDLIITMGAGDVYKVADALIMN